MKNWFVQIGDIFMPAGDAAGLGILWLILIGIIAAPILVVYAISYSVSAFSEVAAGRGSPEDWRMAIGVSLYLVGLFFVFLCIFGVFGFCIFSPHFCMNVEYFLRGNGF